MRGCWVACLILGLCVFASAAWAVDVVVESISGSVELRAGGKTTMAQEGDAVGHGAHVVTGDAVAVRLLYPNGTHLTLSAKTDLEVRNPEVGAPSGALLEGSISVAVPKTVAPALRKFFIKTNTAVMGVRGTEFVVDHDAAANKTELHTLEGSVEVDKTEKNFAAGKLHRVDALHRLVADHRGLGKVGKFDHTGFARGRAERHPLAHGMRETKLRNRDEIAERREQRSDRPEAGKRPETQPGKHEAKDHAGGRAERAKDKAKPGHDRSSQERPGKERREKGEKRERPGRRD